MEINVVFPLFFLRAALRTFGFGAAPDIGMPLSFFPLVYLEFITLRQDRGQVALLPPRSEPDMKPASYLSISAKKTPIELLMQHQRIDRRFFCFD